MVQPCCKVIWPTSGKSGNDYIPQVDLFYNSRPIHYITTLSEYLELINIFSSIKKNNTTSYQIKLHVMLDYNNLKLSLIFCKTLLGGVFLVINRDTVIGDSLSTSKLLSAVNKWTSDKRVIMWAASGDMPPPRPPLLWRMSHHPLTAPCRANLHTTLPGNSSVPPT